MEYKLIRIETYGMKNIKELITIDFSPLVFDNTSKKKVSKVKSIYGINGVGKSAIINSILLYKQLSLDHSLLKQKSEIIKLNKIINKVIKEFYISIIYAFKESKKDKYTIFKNEITIKIDNETPYIELERLSKLKDSSINGIYKTLYEVRNSELFLFNKNESMFDVYLKKRTANILKYSTFTSILKEPDVIKDLLDTVNVTKKDSRIDYGILSYLMINKMFSDRISIFMEENDIHREYDDEEFDYLINNAFDLKNELLFRNTIKSKRDIVLKSQINNYKKNIKRLTDFLNLFKPDLIEIKLDISEDEYYYYCSKKMIYPKYEVDSDYESTGIQKLMQIYNSIEDVTNGGIVFIDELDANINGVYLRALIKYLNDINKGQLCFTTHNFYTMEYLYKYAYSIDFLGETGKLIPWKKNGNYKPYNQYPEGMIVDSPFNIDSIDFVRVFEREGDN